jgi:hypothetical protein
LTDNTGKFSKMTKRPKPPPKGSPKDLARFARYRARRGKKKKVARVEYGEAMRKHLVRLGLLQDRPDHTREEVAVALGQLPELTFNMVRVIGAEITDYQ